MSDYVKTYNDDIYNIKDEDEYLAEFSDTSMRFYNNDFGENNNSNNINSDNNNSNNNNSNDINSNNNNSNNINSNNNNSNNNNPKTIRTKRKVDKSITSTWENYKYTLADVNKMNELIKKYSNVSPSNDKETRQNTSRKRKTEQMDTDRTKRIKVNVSNDSTNFNPNGMLGWVSATRTKYYLLHDQSIDWLTMYYDKIGIGPEYQSSQLSLNPNKHFEENKNLIKDASHINILFDGGNVFEKKIFEELKNIFNDYFVLVFTEEDMIKYHEQRETDGIFREKNMFVKNLMDKGVPLIAQAPLINESNKTFGVADILIRSDYLSVLFHSFIPDKDINVKAPFLKMKGTDSYHYRVIDIKWTTMVLCVDGLTIRNEGFMPAYKGQLAVYTAALENLQGYIPNYAYIMPKAWRIDKSKVSNEQKSLYRGFSAFDRPGIINYSDRDKDYLIKTKEAIQWVQRVMTEGREWRYNSDKPTVPEMYPNMNKSFNPAYDKVKEKLADRYGDPTMVWYVGTNHRDAAHSKGIYDVRDPKCTLEVLGIPDKGRGSIIKQIMDINRHNQTSDLVRPKKIANNLFGWKDENHLDYYVDFETINYNLFINPTDMNIDASYIDSDVTFMIGIGFNHNDKVSSDSIVEGLNMDKNKCDCFINIDKIKGWEFICFHLVNFKIQNEIELFRLFYQFILLRQEMYNIIYGNEKVKNDNNKNDIFNLSGTQSSKSRMFHWTDAESRFLRRANHRIYSGEYTKYHMENPKLNFTEENGEKTSENQVQKELDRLLDTFEKLTIWIDMYKIFEQVPITVKGSFRFSLKNIGNAFNKNGLIDTNWSDGRMSNGFRAMLEAIKLYRTLTPMSKNVMLYKEIIDYNEVDCRVIWEIVKYLKANHC